MLYKDMQTQKIVLYVIFLILAISLFLPSLQKITCFNESCDYLTTISPLYEINPYGISFSINSFLIIVAVIFILYSFIQPEKKIVKQLFWIALIFLTYVASLPFIIYFGLFKFLYPAGIILITIFFIAIRKTFKLQGKSAFESKDPKIRRKAWIIWSLLFALILIPWIVFYGLFILMKITAPHIPQITETVSLNIGAYLMLVSLFLLLYYKLKNFSFGGKL